MTSFCHFRVLVLRVTGGGSRRSNPVRDTQSKRFRNSDGPKGSNPLKRNIKKTASKDKEANVDYDTMPLKEYVRRQKINSYVTERVQMRGCELFWSKQQALIYQDVVLTRQKIYVRVQWIDLNHLQRDPLYFGEALNMIQQLGIEDLITFPYDFDPDIVAQFYVTVHFHVDVDRTMTWMTNGEKMSGSWIEFMKLLNVPDEVLHNPVGLRPHANPGATPKEKLMPFYLRKNVLPSFLDVMHRIFRNTLFPRVGNKDQVHSYLMDMLLMCEEGRTKNSGPLDVSNVMFCELQMAIYNRKVPIYGSYLYYFIKTKWSESFPRVPFPAAIGCISHELIKLRQKDKWANTSSRTAERMETEQEAVAAEDEGGPATHTRSSAEPSWAKKLKDQMRTLFCMQAKAQYLTHVAQKESH